jgi:hypothetical protein
MYRTWSKYPSCWALEPGHFRVKRPGDISASIWTGNNNFVALMEPGRLYMVWDTILEPKCETYRMS